MGQPGTETIEDWDQTLGLPDLPLQTELRQHRTRELAKPQRERARNIRWDDVSANEELTQALGWRWRDRGESGCSKRDVRHRKSLEFGEHRKEAEEVHGVHERRKD